jgi:hypothetical protein
MASAHPNPELLRYAEQNLAQAEVQCLRLASLIKCRRAKGRETKSYERLLDEMRDAVNQVLRTLPLSSGD